MEKVKLLIIGAGPGGYVAAIRAAQLGLEPVVIERGFLGGTCLNRGCIPTKALISAAETFNSILSAEAFGITANAEFDWTKVNEHAKNSAAKNRMGIAYLFKKNNVRHVHGEAVFTSPHTVKAGETEFEAENIIIATGSVSLSVNPDYNSALAHALYYGLTVREWMERKHLHGEIVSYGTLVQLLLDEQYEELRRVYDFNKSVGLPVCLKDLDLEKDDPLDDVLDATIVNQELDHIPYPITKQMVKETILKLEDYK